MFERGTIWQLYYSDISRPNHLCETVLVAELSCHRPSCLDPTLIWGSLLVEEEEFEYREADSVAIKGNNQLKYVFYSSPRGIVH